MDVNKVTLIGRLTKKPQLRETASGQKVASFSVATNYMWRDYKTKEKHDTTQFHRVIVWGKLADIASTYLDKASRVYLEGRLQYREWQDTEGKKRYGTDVIADELIMLGHNGSSKKSSSSEAAFVKEGPGEKELVVEEV